MTTDQQLTQSGPSSATDAASQADRPQVNVESAKDAASEAKNVGLEAAEQAKKLTTQMKTEVEHQVMQSRDKLCTTLRSLGDEMEQMATTAPQQSLSTQAVQKIAESARASAGFLEQRDLADLNTELRQFASARPGLFLGGAVIAGGLLGRLTRSTIDRNSNGEADVERASSATGRGQYGNDVSYDPTPRNADTPIAASTSEALGFDGGAGSNDVSIARSEGRF